MAQTLTVAPWSVKEREAAERAGLNIRRLAFYRWLFLTGRLSDN